MIKKMFLVFLFCLNINAAEVKVLFADSLSSETSEIQPFLKWYVGSEDGKTTLSQMYSEGWKLVDVVKLNAVADSRQFWIFMER